MKFSCIFIIFCIVSVSFWQVSAVPVVFFLFLPVFLSKLTIYTKYLIIFNSFLSDFRKNEQKTIRKEKIQMKITLDLDTCDITVPKNFFKNIEKQNDLIAKHGGTPVKPMDVIRNSFATAMENTDKYVHVKE